MNIERAVAETAARALQATSTLVLSCSLPPAERPLVERYINGWLLRML